MTLQEYLKLLGTDRNNAAALVIWETLQMHDYVIIKRN